jgi:hypothetical protein
MSEENIKDDTAPALLPDNETVIDAEKTEAYKEALENIVKEVKEKAVVSEAKQEDGVISSPDAEKVAEPSVPALAPVSDGVIGSSSAVASKKKPTTDKPAKKEDTVAIHSTRNVTWSGIGKVYNGYNIVSKAAAEKWLSRSHVRLATPEEVAREFGK